MMAANSQLDKNLGELLYLTAPACVRSSAAGSTSSPPMLGVLSGLGMNETESLF